MTSQKKKYSDAIIRGVEAKDFPHIPVDYGYRDSKNFWYHRHNWMRSELLQMRKGSLESVRYAADRIDDKIKFSKWTLTEEMVGDTHVGEMSFKQYIFDSFKK